MAFLRTFIALELPGVVRQTLANAICRLEYLGDRVRWTKPDSAHVTLKYLGDVDAVRIQELVDTTRQVTADVRPLVLKTTGLGGFPNRDMARVIWMGLGGDLDGLCDLQARIEAGFERLGFATERGKFFPHVTLGRVRRGPVGVDADRVGTVQAVHFQVDRAVVMQSVLRPDGAVYTPLGYGVFTGKKGT